MLPVLTFDSSSCKALKAEVKPFKASKGISNCTNSIRRISTSIMNCLGNALHFPTRYLGSKTWSIPGIIVRTPVAIFEKILKNDNESLKHKIFGPSANNNLEPLSPQHTQPYLKHVFALIAGHIAYFGCSTPFGLNLVKPESFNIPKSALPNNLQARENSFFDPISGLKVTLFEKGNEVIVAFGGLKSYDTENCDSAQQEKLKRTMQSTIAANLLGLKPKIFLDAEIFLKALSNSPSMKNKKIVLTGQCYGGAVASYLGIKHQLTTICFNSSPLGAGLQQDIGDEKLLQAHKYVTHITVKNDYMSDAWQLNFPDRLLSLVGIRTPANFGKRFVIPSVFKDYIKTHAYVSGSMMNHIGLDSRTKPENLPANHSIFQHTT